MAFTPLNALSAFVTVARRRSFAVAARELAISASAVSQSVRQLEARLGVTLLTRTTRSVALTDAGRRLVEEAGPGIDRALEALRSAPAEPGELVGRVRLSAPQIAVDTVLAPLLPRFFARHPRVEVEIRVENRVVDVVAEGLDGGIRLSEFVARDMVQVRLTDAFRFVVVAAPAYLERRGVPRRPEDVLAHDCICYRSATTGAIYQWELERGRRRWRLPVHGPLTTDDHAVTLAMAEAGLGLAYMAEPEIAERVESGRLRVILEGYAAEVPGLFLCFPSRGQMSPAFRAFADMARELRS
jgi:DNA-binding transcriptional LysR family regulator